MLDKYGVGDDPYCYPGTNLLKNKLSIQDEKLLTEAERDLSFVAAAAIEFKEPPYDLAYLCNIHHALFSDLYEWSGKLREVDITKGHTRFCNVSFIENEANKLLNKLSQDNYLVGLEYSEFITKLSEYYCDLNMIHPFREGNGRAQRIFFEHLVINAGFEISFDAVSVDDWIEANILGVHCDFSKMKAVLNICVS